MDYFEAYGELSTSDKMSRALEIENSLNIETPTNEVTNPIGSGSGRVVTNSILQVDFATMISNNPTTFNYGRVPYKSLRDPSILSSNERFSYERYSQSPERRVIEDREEENEENESTEPNLAGNDEEEIISKNDLRLKLDKK